MKQQPDIGRQSTAPTPSYITLPNLQKPYPSLLDFLDQRFPFVGREVWQHRLESNKISDEHGNPVDMTTPFRRNARLRYFREVEDEHPIPFQEYILFQNDSILVADKPHFLPVTPSGSYVNECLLHRLRRKTGLDHLVPVHRLDRETAGLVLFSCDAKRRGPWFDLFRQGNISKRYEAIATCPVDTGQREWLIESRIERGEPWLRFRNVEGEINARSRIRLVEARGELAKFELEPITGKTHQLRLHLGLIGANIVGDRFYPDFQPPQNPPNYDNPLQLLAKNLAFTDPLSGEARSFESRFTLDW
ncbi:MAG: pseudouridine synthase [Zetaproteobacteria bacterium CG12_big_fil_rev_8_21_14_0_65_55_1124]|nr:MAG: pseudouridine synthase [Zetaproteobacteria bacterium CG1_02_55_237]PIS18396.1 MAG: pseudouridine synthase [Zetaproteobacteria bacterium CG08_land_8_20_14_0_20_55_17]PIW42148.1 MAG: pseudouridine synthase [Zetaproteobacteria bacterium CG12_big_fil_rev_8_21_14_0_65_55_1124]PIY53246.1 MAG: pseudouridine synthase [Zetaproteobacteria bacterium CG_4_10_14_0_8_um_filter_55_43]PIZ38616.1 MAG: pseudouridine synthase [Zetaproteobacteria bacterium CG_4_10_14_0_2_um_filter_55_20]PJB82262.1 MAG: ps